jgi:hypothetical protein
LIRTSLEDVGASITSGGKVVVMAVSTVQLVVTAGEGLVHQAVGAVHALEAFLMPVLVLVRQVLKQWNSLVRTFNHTHTRTFNFCTCKTGPGIDRILLPGNRALTILQGSILTF